MNEGKNFEASIKASAEKCGIYFLRLKDSATSWNQQGSTSFTAKNPFDSIMYKNPYMFTIECKSSKGTSFSFDEKIIKENQIKQLLKASEYEGIVSGFIFNFRSTNTTYFVMIQEFVKFKETSGKKSINEKDLRQIGLLIPQTLKKVRWHYHIDEFIKHFVNISK